MEKHEYDEINYFVFDALGYLRWYSPADSFDLVKFPNEAILKFLENDYKIYSSNGFFKIKVNKESSLKINLNFTTKKENLEAFGNDSRFINEILSTIENNINVSMDIESYSISPSENNNLIVSVNISTGLNDDGSNNKLKESVYNKIKAILFDKFKIIIN